MDKIRKSATATAFRRAREARLKLVAAAERRDFQRLLRDVAFDRFLARLFSSGKAPWVLKGGYALELRIKEARVTKDIDLALRESLGKERGEPLSRAIFEALTAAAAREMDDFFSFRVGEAMHDLDAAPYGGARFPVTARLDARDFVKFHIDVAAGDVVLSPLDTTEGHGWLNFAGIPPAKFPTISR
ncbi:MAG: nucleotidyl transferase AbiEii/AbiGii toxin family protein, partial [Elusimicrobiota bacterium]